MERTPVLSALFFVIAALLGAMGQFLYQSGAEHAHGSWQGYLLNVRILTGAACYIGVMVLFVAAFRKGGALTVLYPIYASTFIWAAFIAWWAYQVPVRGIHVLGMALLVLGMYCMGRPA